MLKNICELYILCTCRDSLADSICKCLLAVHELSVNVLAVYIYTFTVRSYFLLGLFALNRRRCHFNFIGYSGVIINSYYSMVRYLLRLTVQSDQLIICGSGLKICLEAESDLLACVGGSILSCSCDGLAVYSYNIFSLSAFYLSRSLIDNEYSLYLIREHYLSKF